LAYKNCYDLLGIGIKANQKEIKHAYRKKMFEWHPDRNTHRITEAEENSKIFNQAYSILYHPDRRKQYDRMLRYTKGKDYGKGIREGDFNSKVAGASSVMKTATTNMKTLYSMYVDGLKRKYKLHPSTLGMIAGGLFYFINPFDLIPDFIPLIGFLDDLAVITAISHAIEDELTAYRLWKNQAFND